MCLCVCFHCVEWKGYLLFVKRPLFPYLSSSLSPDVPSPGFRSPYLLPPFPSPAFHLPPPIPSSPPFVPECDLPVQLLDRTSSDMVCSGEGESGLDLLAEYNGQKFKYNDLVDVISYHGYGTWRCWENV